MICYIDSSALAKHYLDEPETEIVERNLSETDTLITSEITKLEMISFFERSKRGKRIDSPTYRLASHNFDRDLEKKTFVFFSISSEIIADAKRLIRLRQLRPADAIQLSSALLAHRRFDRQVHFLCFDHTLLEAARLEGLKCLPIT